MKALVRAILAFSFIASADALADCYAWPLREPLAYDGDTVYLTIPALPPELRQVSARLLNIDAPEINGGCPAEKALALEARDALRALLAGAREVITCPIGWDKYGGRVDAMIWADGLDVGEEMVRRGLARPYDGKRRGSWCD